MATLSSIKKQIAELEKKAQELIKKESAKAIAKVRELIEEYGLTAEDIGLPKRSKTSARKASGGRAKRGSKKVGKAVGVPMYRDPDTGKTWTGRGKPPTWIAGAKDRSTFLIDQPAAAESSSAGRPPAAKKSAVASRKSAAKPAPKMAASRKEAKSRTTKVRATREAPAKRKGGRGKAAGRAVGGMNDMSVPGATPEVGEQSA